MSFLDFIPSSPLFFCPHWPMHTHTHNRSHTNSLTRTRKHSCIVFGRVSIDYRGKSATTMVFSIRWAIFLLSSREREPTREEKHRMTHDTNRMRPENAWMEKGVRRQTKLTIIFSFVVSFQWPKKYWPKPLSLLSPSLSLAPYSANIGQICMWLSVS